MTVIDRIENSKMEKKRKILFFISIGLVLISILKYFTRLDHPESGWGWWVDILILFIPGVYFIYASQTKLKIKASQFIEWNSDKITYSLEDGVTKSITNSSIVDISIKLHTVDILDNQGQSHQLNIRDFIDFKTRTRIKDNFQKQKELCLAASVPHSSQQANVHK